MPAGDSGDMAIDRQILGYYFQQGYEIVQVAWSTAWEATQIFSPQGDLRPMETSRTLPAAQPHF
jgi:hypothetical protein